MSQQKTSKYSAFPPVKLIDRQWPNRVIDKAPMWMSTDLRDGNQALFEPMNADKKMQMFKTLCQIGFKQIEIAFPSASETEFGFVRRLIEEKHIPDDDRPSSTSITPPARASATSSSA
jgi:2-isopropylmalate synthase